MPLRRINSKGLVNTDDQPLSDYVKMGAGQIAVCRPRGGTDSGTRRRQMPNGLELAQSEEELIMLLKRKSLAYSVIAAVLVGTAGMALAASQSGDVAVKIIQPLVITQITPMDFGTVAPDTLVDADFNLSTAGVVTPAIAGTGEVWATDPATTAAAGQFSVSGGPSLPYTVSFPAGPVLLDTGGGGLLTQPSMIGFTANPAAGNLTAGGAATINVGGTLRVPANQTPGNYTGIYTIIVSYQ